MVLVKVNNTPKIENLSPQLIELTSPELIYQQISQAVARVLEKLHSLSETESAVSDAQLKAREILEKYQHALNTDMRSLKNNAEWDIFTLAFYGETNAGKSTIIETLRILLGEQRKKEAQRLFRQLQDEHGLTEDNFNSLRQSIQQMKELLDKILSDLKEQARLYKDKTEAIDQDIARLTFEITEKKKIASLWQKIFNLFKKLPEEKKLKQLIVSKKIDEKHRNVALALAEKQQAQTQQQLNNAEQNLSRMESALPKLTSFADGAIIGDGRSDYTIETQRYECEVNGKKFALLDMPGIEGKEAIVSNQIIQSVQKAHAVFYVTGKATAPQTGDEHTPGTIEKIKAHLGDQTEVWTIFNKRITNPHQLEERQLIDSGESESLSVLDEKMRSQLVEHYRETFSLSAMPAFFAAAEHLVPGSDNAEKRNKFLLEMNPQELLQKTNMQQFVELLTRRLLHECKEKIKRSNFNKANNLLKTAINHVGGIQNTLFLPLEAQLQKEMESSCKQMDYALAALESRLAGEGNRAITTFKTSARKQIYKRIESNISNDEFKYELRNCIEEHHASLEKRLPDIIKNELDKFQSEIKEIADKYQQYAKELLEIYSKTSDAQMDTEFDLQFTMKSGLKIAGLISAIVGGVVSLWTPVGWFLLAVGLASLIFNVFKSIRSLLSSDYKMQQQRESSDKNLNSVASDMEESLRKSLEKPIEELKETVQKIKQGMKELVMQVAEINRILSSSAEDLRVLSRAVDALM